MMFFYTGRLSSSTSGGLYPPPHPRSSFDASLLRGFQQDVVGDDGIGSCTVVEKILRLCNDQYQICLKDKACLRLLRTEISVKCNCDSDFSCYDDAVKTFGIVGNTAIDNFIGCAHDNAGDEFVGKIDAPCVPATGDFSGTSKTTFFGYSHPFETCYRNGNGASWTDYCWTKSFARVRVLVHFYQCVPNGYTGDKDKGWHAVDTESITYCGPPCEGQHQDNGSLSF